MKTKHMGKTEKEPESGQSRLVSENLGLSHWVKTQSQNKMGISKNQIMDSYCNIVNTFQETYIHIY